MRRLRRRGLGTGKFLAQPCLPASRTATQVCACHSMVYALNSLTYARTHRLGHSNCSLTAHHSIYLLTHSAHTLNSLTEYSQSLTHYPLTHSLTHSLTRSLTHLLTHGLIRSLTAHYITAHSLTPSLTHSLTSHSLTHSCTQSLTYSLTHSFARSLLTPSH